MHDLTKKSLVLNTVHDTIHNSVHVFEWLISFLAFKDGVDGYNCVVGTTFGILWGFSWFKIIVVMQMLAAFLVLITVVIAQTTNENPTTVIFGQTTQEYPITVLMSQGTQENPIEVAIAETTPKKLDLLFPDYKPISSLQILHKNNATSDAQYLFEAMDGPGTTENVIINILSHRTEKQRKEIAKKYKELYDQDLMDDLKGDLSGDLEDIITGLLEGPSLFLATRLHKALVEGWFTDETAIIDIIAPLTNEEIAQVEIEYNKKYQPSLVDELSNGKNEFYRRFLLSMVENSRLQHAMPNEDVRAEDLERFCSAVENMDPLDENTFKTILFHRDPSYVRQLLKLCTISTGRKIEDNIKEQTWGTMRDTLLAIVESIQDRTVYFAKRLHKAMDGFGTDEEALTRILVSRAEKDLGNIKQQYEILFGHSLLSDILDEMSGDDKAAMVALIAD